MELVRAEGREEAAEFGRGLRGDVVAVVLYVMCLCILCVCVCVVENEELKVDLPLIIRQCCEPWPICFCGCTCVGKEK